MSRSIGMIGFGEAGRTLAAVVVSSAAGLTVYDRAFTDPARGEALRSAVAGLGARAARGPEALAGCDVVLSLVTPATAVQAATAYAPSARDGVLFIDLNSTAPRDKREIAAVLGRARVVDGVMTGGGIRLDGARIPISLAGPQAHEAGEILVGLGLNAAVVGTEVGAAAALKMLRGVVIKGLEALYVEAMLAADELGLVEPLLTNIEETLDRWPARDFAAMLVTTHVAHAGRRRIEAGMVRDTVAGAGVEPTMASATAARLGRTAEGLRELGRSPGDVPATLAEALAVLRQLPPPPGAGSPEPDVTPTGGTR